MSNDKSSLNLLLDRMRNKDIRLVPISKTIVGKLVSYPTLSKWVHNEGFPAVQIGTRWYSENESLVDWIIKNCPKLAPFVTEVRDDSDPPPEAIVEPEEPEQQQESEDYELL